MNHVNWDKLRTDVYLRDKGICWVCNTPVTLLDYDLGHLIDKSMGGEPIITNLVVMHKECNRLKPFHKTLEEAIKWKLQFNLDNVNPNFFNDNINYKMKVVSPLRRKAKRVPPSLLKVSQKTIAKQTQKLESLKDRIKPCTICWIQGRPYGGAMWKVLPPPYTQDDLFCVRITPPGAIDNGLTGTQDTIQVINGILTEPIDVELGTANIHIEPNKDKPIITFTQNKRANSGNQTVGLGKNQIPIEKWELAKKQGISFQRFIDNYHDDRADRYDYIDY